MKHLSGVLLGLAALAGAVCPILMPTAASADQITVYVSHHASSGNADSSCATSKYTTINGAIHAVVAGGTVVVCRGTYRTQAVVLKPVRLEGPGRADRPGGPEAGHPLVRATFGGTTTAECTRRSSSLESSPACSVVDVHPARGSAPRAGCGLAGGTGTRAVR